MSESIWPSPDGKHHGAEKLHDCAVLIALRRSFVYKGCTVGAAFWPVSAPVFAHFSRILASGVILAASKPVPEGPTDHLNKVS